MKLLEKLTDEEIDTQCSEQIVDVLQIAERIVEAVTTLHRSESQNESLHKSSTCQDSHKLVEKIVKDSQSPAASCERQGTTQQ